MTKRWNNPETLLILGAGVALIASALTGGLKPWFFGDSEGYIALSQGSLFSANALAAFRTLGYPFLLKLFSAFGSEFRAVPFFHFAILVGCLALFYRGLGVMELGKASRALSVASIFIYCMANPQIHPALVATDPPGLYLAIGTLGLFLQTLRKKATTLDWGWLAALLFLTYQVRPAYLFLIPLLPVLGLLCLAYFFPKDYKARRRTYCFRLCRIAFVPLFLFCSLRFFVVGHFGLVSYGGTNLVGIAGQFLTPEMVGELSDNVRPLGKAILERRDDPEILATYGLKSWENPLYGRYGVTASRVREYFNYTAWQVAYPPALEIYGDDKVKVNQAFSRLSREVLARSLGRYANWIFKAFLQSVLIFMTSYSCLVGIGLFVLAFALQVLLRVFPPRSVPALASDPGTLRSVEFFLLTGIVFFSFQTGMTVAVEIPLDRYVLPASVFLPALLVSASLAVADPVFAAWRKGWRLIAYS